MLINKAVENNEDTPRNPKFDPILVISLVIILIFMVIVVRGCINNKDESTTTSQFF